MPWREVATVDLRREFCCLVQSESATISELCRRYGISRKTGYKWLGREQSQGQDGLADRSRRPQHSPARTPVRLESQVLSLRQAHPAWGGRKIAARLRHLGHVAVPAPSTVTDILRRHGLLNPADHARPHWQRFEHANPNDLWQIDFMGHFGTGQGNCHALTMLDDHSRFNLLLQACARTDTDTVRPWLVQTFERYGLPIAINTDNGAPWGSPAAPGALSELTVWLVRLGIRCSHSRPYHPQTNGKEERFHRSLQAEVLNGRAFFTLDQVQGDFTRWRQVYNHERPHQAIGLEVPGTRYRISPRAYPASLPPINYGPDDQVRKAQANGLVSFRGRFLKVSNALRGQPVAFRPRLNHDGSYDVFFCHHRLGEINLGSE